MPKVNYGKNVLLEKQKRDTVALINYCTHIMGLSAKELATKIGVCEATIYNRIQDPEKITLRELVALCGVVKQEVTLPQVQIGGD